MTAKVTRSNPDGIKQLLKRYKGGAVAIGWPVGNAQTSTKYPDGVEVLNVVAWNLYGTQPRDGHPGTPPRDFMTPGGNAATEKAAPVAQEIVKSINRGQTTAEKGLKILGEIGVNEVKKAIRDLKEPPNAPSTIEKKKSSNPLVDTGLMTQTVTYQIRK